MRDAERRDLDVSRTGASEMHGCAETCGRPRDAPDSATSASTSSAPRCTDPERAVEAADEVDQRRTCRPRSADQADHFASSDAKRDACERLHTLEGP